MVGVGFGKGMAVGVVPDTLSAEGTGGCGGSCKEGIIEGIIDIIKL